MLIRFVKEITDAEKKKFGLFGGAPAKVKITLKAGPAETAEEFLSNVLKNMKLESVSIKMCIRDSLLDGNINVSCNSYFKIVA